MPNEFVVLKRNSSPTLFVQTVTPPPAGSPDSAYYTAQLTVNESSAMSFATQAQADAIAGLLDPSQDFVGARPPRGGK